MSHFTDLIGEALALGADKLTWTCDLKDWALDERRHGRWRCTASGPDVSVQHAAGRTGEEALREVVAIIRMGRT